MPNKSSFIRVFFGIPVPEDWVDSFKDRVIQENPKLNEQVRWTLPGNHHITIRFLGNIAPQKIPPLIELVGENAIGMDSFEVFLCYICPFPVRHGALSAVTIQLSSELQTLYNTINLAVSNLDFPEENRPYLPHITLFRSKTKLQTAFQKIQLDNETLLVNEMILYQSIPTEKGSLYKPIHRFPFAK